MERTMTPNEIAKILRCRPEYVYRILESGDLAGFRIGKGWRVTPESLKEWIAKREEK